MPFDSVIETVARATTENQTQRDLRAAMRVLNHGENWTKGAWQSWGEYCLVGAVSRAVHGHDNFEYGYHANARVTKAVRYLSRAARELFPERASVLSGGALIKRAFRPVGFSDACLFNECRWTTWADVETVANRALELAA